MQVTEVRLQAFEDKGRMKAVSSVTFDREFVVHDIKLIQGDESLFIAFPSKKDKEGKFADICHPISQEMRNKVQEAVIEKYNDVLASQSEEK